MNIHELKCKYKHDAMPENMRRKARIQDAAKCTSNSSWRGVLMCVNGLCANREYEKAVCGYHHFIEDLTAAIQGDGHCPWWFRVQAYKVWSVLPRALHPNFVQSVCLHLPTAFNGKPCAPMHLFMERHIMSSFVPEKTTLEILLFLINLMQASFSAIRSRTDIANSTV